MYSKYNTKYTNLPFRCEGKNCNCCCVFPSQPLCSPAFPVSPLIPISVVLVVRAVLAFELSSREASKVPMKGLLSAQFPDEKKSCPYSGFLLRLLVLLLGLLYRERCWLWEELGADILLMELERELGREGRTALSESPESQRG